MSAKSAIKTVVAAAQPPSPGEGQVGQGDQQLFQWVALLTGS